MRAMSSLYHPSAPAPRQHDLAKLIDSRLSRTSASSLGIAGCNPSGPVSLPTPSRTALLLASLHLPQQQAQLAGQTACKNIHFASSGQALPFINPSACNNRHQDLGSAATCSMLASNSPWQAPTPLSLHQTLCTELASPLGSHLN